MKYNFDEIIDRTRTPTQRTWRGGGPYIFHVRPGEKIPVCR